MPSMITSSPSRSSACATVPSGLSWRVDRLEAERALEPVDRRGGVAVAERGVDGHAAQARPASRPRLGRM